MKQQGGEKWVCDTTKGQKRSELTTEVVSRLIGRHCWFMFCEECVKEEHSRITAGEVGGGAPVGLMQF